ncbi:hypothetical protein BUL74_01790 [Salmonella enterica subsp. enterica serovar 4,[5],12:i:-]|nr:hypothetical protein [Salmonella enterica]ECU8272965.1 hypothetical protein [Salmonella enterica subsp. enterica serovar 4,[5],12:i:-]
MDSPDCVECEKRMTDERQVLWTEAAHWLWRQRKHSPLGEDVWSLLEKRPRGLFLTPGQATSALGAKGENMRLKNPNRWIAALISAVATWGSSAATDVVIPNGGTGEINYSGKVPTIIIDGDIVRWTVFQSRIASFDPPSWGCYVCTSRMVGYLPLSYPASRTLTLENRDQTCALRWIRRVTLDASATTTDINNIKTCVKNASAGRTVDLNDEDVIYVISRAATRGELPYVTPNVPVADQKLPILLDAYPRINGMLEREPHTEPGTANDIIMGMGESVWGRVEDDKYTTIFALKSNSIHLTED